MGQAGYSGFCGTSFSPFTQKSTGGIAGPKYTLGLNLCGRHDQAYGLDAMGTAVQWVVAGLPQPGSPCATIFPSISGRDGNTMSTPNGDPVIDNFANILVHELVESIVSSPLDYGPCQGAWQDAWCNQM